MKRIIDGVTYNTDTSTRLAVSDYETLYNNESRPCQGTLYQTRGGAFFVWQAIDLASDGDSGELIVRNRFEALSAKEAEEWIMTGDTEVFHNPFGEPPEAEAEDEPGSTIYLRVPTSLKKRVEEAAERQNLSTNAWTMRCIEDGLMLASADRAVQELIVRRKATDEPASAADVLGLLKSATDNPTRATSNRCR
jgi:predicted HicB family RNase H-like nuclease